MPESLFAGFFVSVFVCRERDSVSSLNAGKIMFSKWQKNDYFVPWKTFKESFGLFQVQQTWFQRLEWQGVEQVSPEWVFPLLLDADLREGGGCFDPALLPAGFVAPLILGLCSYPLILLQWDFSTWFSTLPTPWIAPGSGKGSNTGKYPNKAHFIRGQFQLSFSNLCLGVKSVPAQFLICVHQLQLKWLLQDLKHSNLLFIPLFIPEDCLGSI